MTEQKSNTLKYVGIGCGLLLLLSCCTGGGIAAYCAQQFKGPETAVNTFLKEIREGNFEQAKLRHTTYRAQPGTVLQAAAAQHPSLMATTGASFSNYSVSNGVYTLRGSLEGAPSTIEATLMAEGEHFIINQLIIDGRPL